MNTENIQSESDLSKKRLEIKEKFKQLGFDYYQELDKFWRSDKEIALYAIKRLPEYLTYASDTLKDDEDVVTTALTYQLQPYIWINGKLEKNDFEKTQDTKLKSQEQRLQCQTAFIQASNRLKSDKNFIMKHIVNIPQIIQYLGNADLYDDEDIILASLKENYANALSYASNRLKLDKHFVIKAIRLNVHSFAYIDSKWRADRDVVKVAFNQDVNIAYKSFTKEDKDKMDVLLLIFEFNPFQFNNWFSQNVENKEELYIQLTKKMALEDESFFIQAFLNMDNNYNNRNADKTKPSVWLGKLDESFNPTINLMLSNISKESLIKINVKHNYLQLCLAKEISKKTIMDVNFNTNIKKPKTNSRKVF